MTSISRQRFYYRNFKDIYRNDEMQYNPEKMIRLFLRQHILSITCYFLFLALWLNAIWSRSRYHGLYAADGQINAVPLERAFNSLMLTVAAASVIFLIALAKLVFGREDKRYYACFCSLIVLHMLLLGLLVTF